MNNLALLSNEELIEKIQKEEDEETKAFFVERNTPLVYSIVKRFSRQRVSNEDLFQIGCIGLMKALNNFDLEYGVKYSTYAVPIIMGEIKRYFRDDGSMRISRSLKEGYVKMVRCKEELAQEFGREATYQEIAKHLEMDISDVILAFDANQFVYSLDEPIYESDGAPIHLEDKVSDQNQEDIVLKLSLVKEMKKLDTREQLLLHYRFVNGMKQDEIAKKLQVSQVQVSRLEKKILAKLKERLVEG